MDLQLVTSGQSHGPGIVAILSGMPAGLVVDRERMQRDLARRQAGYGRSPRQKIEQDTAEILGGMRHGQTLGGPISLMVANRDHANWGAAMSAWEVTQEELEEVAARRWRKVNVPRPGHADLAGVMKYELDDVRNVLERASARETCARVAAGAICKDLLALLGIEVLGHVVQVGDVAADPQPHLTAADFARRETRSWSASTRPPRSGCWPPSTPRSATRTRSAASSRCASSAARPASARTPSPGCASTRASARRRSRSRP